MNNQRYIYIVQNSAYRPTLTNYKMNKTKKYLNDFPHFFANRNLKDIDSINNFIIPTKEWINDPFLFDSMDVAVSAILSNSKKQPIFIHGDCDADGVSSCAVLYKYLKRIGFNVDYYIPNRSQEGHAISKNAIDYAISIGSRLMITCDIGMSSKNEILYAKNKNLATIITDHHKVLEDIPEAIAIINPWLKQNSKIPFREYSGSGVAFKLCHAINIRLSLRFDDLYNLMELAVIGIIADKVSIINENRYLSHYGFEMIIKGNNPGLSLLNKKLFSHYKDININKIIRIINTTTKHKDSSLAVKLLTTNNPVQINNYTNTIIKDFNRNHLIFLNIINSSIRQTYSQNYKKNNSIFILTDSDSAYNGAIANILSHKFNVPVMIISKMNDSQYKGSCRSIENIDLLLFLESQKNIFINLGGHPMAAGFIIEESNINKIEKLFINYMKNQKTDTIRNTLNIIDGNLMFEDINLEMLDFFRKFMPYGTKNNSPIFISTGVKLAGQPTIIGKNKESIKFKLKQGDKIFNAIGIGLINEFEKLITKNKLNVEYSIFNQKNNIMLNILGVK